MEFDSKKKKEKGKRKKEKRKRKKGKKVHEQGYTHYKHSKHVSALLDMSTQCFSYLERLKAY
jgi:hypothetical protein